MRNISTSLKDVTFSDNLTTIGQNAFGNCPSVETLTVPSSVTYINNIGIGSSGPASFSGMTGLKTLNFYAKNVPDNNFNGLPIETLNLTGVETITRNAFQNCSKLKSVVLTNSLTSIGEYAFQGDSSLVSVTIPASVTSFGNGNNFRDCTGLQSANIQNSTIANFQFVNCTSLKDVTFSDNLTTVGQNAFGNCPSVETLTVPSSVTYINNVGIGSSGPASFSGMTGLKTLNFYAKSVPANNFNGLPIENLDLTGVVSIASNAFAECVKLKNITMTNSLMTIGSGAFGNCSALQQITLPSSIYGIDANAFHNCTGLQQVTARWQMPFAVGSTVFSGVNTHAVRLNTPEGRENAYRAAAVWKDFLIETKLLSYTPAVLGSEGGASITIYGGYLTGDATVELIQNGSVIKAVSVTAGGMGESIATFESGQLPEGNYDLHIAQAGSLDTLITNGISVQTTIYPTVVSSIESNDVLRNFPTTSYLMLHNTGNIDALGVNAYIFVPDAVKLNMDRKNFKEVIDTTKTFDFDCPDFNVSGSIPNSIIAKYMDMIDTGDSIAVDVVAQKPYKGNMYQIYVPRVPAGSDVLIPVRMTSFAPGHSISELISGTETFNLFNPVTSDSLNYLTIERLNNFINLYIGIQDSTVLQKITDFAVWQKTWKVAEEIARQVIAADRNRAGYIDGNIDGNYYDAGIYRKEMAAIILALEAISTNNSSEQRTDGIINFAGYQSSPMKWATNVPKQSKSSAPPVLKAGGLVLYNSDDFQRILDAQSTFEKTQDYANAFWELYRMAVIDNQDPSRQGLRFFSTLTPSEQQRLLKMGYELYGEDFVNNLLNNTANMTVYGPLITPIFQAGSYTLQAGLVVVDKINQNYRDAGVPEFAADDPEWIKQRHAEGLYNILHFITDRLKKEGFPL